MATIEQLSAALVKADAAGNTADAKVFADALRAMKAQGAAVSAGPRPLPSVNPNGAQSPGAFGNNPMATDMPGGPSRPPASLDDMVRSFGANIDQLPGGAPIYNGMRQARAFVQGMTPEQVDAETARARAAAPEADVAGKVFYNAAPWMVAGAVAPKLFGMGEAVPWTAGPRAVVGDIAMRGGAAGLSNLAIGSADSMLRGADPLGAIGENLAPSLAMSSLPLAGAMLRGGGKLAGKGMNWATGNLAPTIGAFWNTEKAGQKAVGRAMAADRSAGTAMTPAEDAFAAANGLDIINLDRGGPATRNLARSAKPTSSEATAGLASAVNRGAPGVDTANFLTKLVGGSADDVKLRAGLDDLGRKLNAPAYAKAESAPAAQHIFTPRLENMMQAPELQSAIKEAEGTGKTWAAISNAPTPGTAPFKIGPDGSVLATPVAPPSLKFWDQVQRNLRGQMENVRPGGEAWNRINFLHKQLLNELDAVVPDFKVARQGAAAVFGAENAMDAGRKFAMQPKNTPEALAAIAKLHPVDRKAFEIGAASTAIDTLKSKDTFASVKQVFQNPNARIFWRATLGDARADQLEMYVKIQAMQEASKVAVLGGSQTHDLLIGGGIMAGGFAANQFGVDPTISGTAGLVGLARFAHGSLGKLVDRKVLTAAAKLLESGDKAALNKLTFNAAMSPKWRAAVNAMFEGMAATSRGAVGATMGATAAVASTPQTDTRDYSNGLPSPVSAGPRVSPMP